MFQPSLKYIPIAGFSLLLVGATTYPENQDTVTLENLTISGEFAHDIIVPGEGTALGVIGTKETTGTNNYTVQVESGADSIWWAQDRIVLRPGVKIHNQGSNGFVWLAGDADWDGFSDQEEAEGVDYDNDGLPDGWEADYGINSSNASGDNDNDGIPNVVEYYFNTNPVSANATSSSVSVSLF